MSLLTSLFKSDDESFFWPVHWFEDSDIDFEIETEINLKHLLDSHQLGGAHDLEHIFTDDFWEIIQEDIQFNK